MKLMPMLKELKEIKQILKENQNVNVNQIANKLTYFYNTDLYQKLANNPIDQKEYGYVEEFSGTHLVGRHGFNIQPKEEIFKLLKQCLRNDVEVDFHNADFLSLLKFTKFLSDTNYHFFSFKADLDIQSGKIFSIENLTPLNLSQINHLDNVMLKNIRKVAISLGV